MRCELACVVALAGCGDNLAAPVELPADELALRAKLGIPATAKTRRWLEVIVANPRSDEPPVAQVRRALRSFSSISHLGMGRLHAPRGS